MRKGIIDLGTNTFNLLIADVTASDFCIVHSEKEGVALGMGGINKNVIASDAFKRGIRTIRHYNLVCIKYHVDEIIAFGTSALRDASNTEAFIEQVYTELGIRVRVITGFEEANLIYRGVQWSYSFKEPAVIMDIGGGSTEFIFANSEGVSDMISLNIGVSRIFQEFKFHDPMTQIDIQSMYNWLDEKSGDFFDAHKEDILIGASGSFETFYELARNKSFPETHKCEELNRKEMDEVLDYVIKSTQAERDANDLIIPIRKRMAPLAAVKTKWMLEKLHVKRIFISPCSLKEGALRIGT
jgi:exopolyphosphatase/guanosine-5'-triphosphate,3'-diphosphate pyrophosphatase